MDEVDRANDALDNLNLQPGVISIVVRYYPQNRCLYATFVYCRLIAQAGVPVSLDCHVRHHFEMAAKCGEGDSSSQIPTTLHPSAPHSLRYQTFGGIMANTENRQTQALPKLSGRHSRRYACAECDQAFKKREHLVRHTRSHTKEKPYTCHVCPKAYGRRYVRDSSHKANAHLDLESEGLNQSLKMYQCWCVRKQWLMVE